MWATLSSDVNDVNYNWPQHCLDMLLWYLRRVNQGHTSPHKAVDQYGLVICEATSSLLAPLYWIIQQSKRDGVGEEIWIEDDLRAWYQEIEFFWRQNKLEKHAWMCKCACLLRVQVGVLVIMSGKRAGNASESEGLSSKHLSPSLARYFINS